MPGYTIRTLVMVLVGVGLLGVGLRFVGINRDVVDFVVPGHTLTTDGAAFYRFHPDEHSVVDGALRFDDALNPPYTMYGSLPLYVLRGTLTVAGWTGVDVTNQHAIYLVGRVVSATLSTLCLAAVWLVTVQVYSPVRATLAAFLLAVAPSAIQQAHYFTVDSLFCLLCTAALAAILWLLDRRTWARAIIAGCLIGLAASVRLNALLLLGVLAIAHLLQRWPQSVACWRARLTDVRLWGAFGTAAAVMIVMQPFLLTAPSRYLQIQGHLDFANVMKVVGGSMLQLYTLQYLHTTPILYQWTHLLPLSIGWPMTLAALLGLLGTLRGVDWRRGVVLLFVGLYLLSAGPMMVKPVRYLLPIVPALLLLAADLCVRLWSATPGVWRWLLRGLVVLTVGHATLYGLAYARIWTTEDSRIQAGRWIAANVPPGARIAVERGAFPMWPMIDPTRHEPIQFRFSLLFNARSNLLCGTEAMMIERNVSNAEYIAIIDANRLTNVAAAPEVMPVLASFYEALNDGRLGYRQVQRFKSYPELAGVRFVDDGAEHTFIGFDHPAVLIYQREPEATASAAWHRWRAELLHEPFCADATIISGAAALDAGNYDLADSLFIEARASSSASLATLLSIVARTASGQAADNEQDLSVHDMIGMSLVDLGLPHIATQVLTLLAHNDDGEGCAAATRYLGVASYMDELALTQQALQIRSLAQSMCPQ